MFFKVINKNYNTPLKRGFKRLFVFDASLWIRELENSFLMSRTGYILSDCFDEKTKTNKQKKPHLNSWKELWKFRIREWKFLWNHVVSTSCNFCYEIFFLLNPNSFNFQYFIYDRILNDDWNDKKSYWLSCPSSPNTLNFLLSFLYVIS